MFASPAGSVNDLRLTGDMEKHEKTAPYFRGNRRHQDGILKMSTPV